MTLSCIIASFVIIFFHEKIVKLGINFAGISTHVITFEVGAVLNESFIQAPPYCFNETTEKKVFSS